MKGRKGGAARCNGLATAAATYLNRTVFAIKHAISQAHLVVHRVEILEAAQRAQRVGQRCQLIAAHIQVLERLKGEGETPRRV